MLDSLRLFVQLSRPLFLIGGALVYALGVGMARYLGADIDWSTYLLGQAIVTLLQLSAHYLNEYFDSPVGEDNFHRTPFSGGNGAIGNGKLSRQTVFLAATTTLAILASLIVILIGRGSASPLVITILALGFLGAFFYSVPPVSLARSGYGELTTSIIVANLVPTFAFILQYGDYHRLLAMSTFPLTTLHLAMMLVFELPDYGSDLRHGKRTLLIRLGWERGMALHNLLILSAFLLLGIAAIYGLPIQIALSGFLPLPLGVLQIVQMRRIASGAKPNWTTLGLMAVALFASEAYFLAFAFWTR